MRTKSELHNHVHNLTQMEIMLKNHPQFIKGQLFLIYLLDDKLLTVLTFCLKYYIDWLKGLIKW